LIKNFHEKNLNHNNHWYTVYSCNKTNTPGPVIEIPMGTLELIDSYDVDVPEPSGLSFGPDMATLLTVSVSYKSNL